MQRNVKIYLQYSTSDDGGVFIQIRDLALILGKDLSMHHHHKAASVKTGFGNNSHLQFASVILRCGSLLLIRKHSD